MSGDIPYHDLSKKHVKRCREKNTLSDRNHHGRLVHVFCIIHIKSTEIVRSVLYWWYWFYLNSHQSMSPESFKWYLPGIWSSYAIAIRHIKDVPKFYIRFKSSWTFIYLVIPFFKLDKQHEFLDMPLKLIVKHFLDKRAILNLSNYLS